ncbi:hypothetical protein TWF132_003262 [Orbilia oligospora]|nr:hypothetical protein TWF132_003262 [Orbilia oligospora]
MHAILFLSYFLAPLASAPSQSRGRQHEQCTGTRTRTCFPRFGFCREANTIHVSCSCSALSRGADHLRGRKREGKGERRLDWTGPDLTNLTKGKAGGAKREDQTTGAPLGNQMIPIHAHAYPSCISATTKLIWSLVFPFFSGLAFSSSDSGQWFLFPLRNER